MTVEQRFIAFDGKEFKTEEECIKYEASIKKLQDVIHALRTVQTICNKHNHCHECVFCNDSSDNCILRKEFPEHWDLERIGIKNEI